VGFAATTSELSIIKSSWDEIISSDGTISINAITINVTNTSVDKYRKYNICSQLILTNGTFGDIACVNSTSLSPSLQQGSNQNLLQIDFEKEFRISNVDIISFDVTTIRQLDVILAEGKNVSIKSDEVTIMFENIQQGGTITINELGVLDVPETVSVNEISGQVIVDFQNQMMTSISTISDISTTTTFDGMIMVEIAYDPSLMLPGVTEDQLKLLRFTEGQWTNVSTTINSEKNTIKALVSGFSNFMVVCPPSPPPASIISASFGGGGPGGGGSGGSSSSVTVLFDLHLYEVSWNICNDNIVTVVAGPPSDGLGVKLRTAKLGIISTTLSDYQPFSNKSVFEARIDPSESFVMIQAEGISGKGALIAQKYLNLDQCSGAVIFESEKSDVPRVKILVPPVSKPSYMLSPSTEFPSKTPEIPGGNQFETSYNEINFEVNYKIDSGQISKISVDEDGSMLMLKLDAIKAGQLILSLPRGLIDAVDDKFVMFETDSGNYMKYSILESEQGYVVILTVLPDELSEITILGTSVIPEFGLMTVSILIVMIIFVILITRHFQVCEIKTLTVKVQDDLKKEVQEYEKSLKK